MRTYLTITFVFALIILGGFLLKDSYNEAIPAQEKPVTIDIVDNQSNQSEVSLSPAKTTPPTEGLTSKTPAENPPNTQTKTLAQPSLCIEGGICTSAEVALHNKRGDCWVSMGALSKVYDITAFVVRNSAMHPGGDIANYCGKDIYDIFMGNTGGHRHSTKALSVILEGYYFAALR